MIVYKQWETRGKKSFYTYVRTWEGWFLLGLVPLYVKQIDEVRHY